MKDKENLQAEALKKASKIIKAAAIKIRQSDEKIAELQQQIDSFNKNQDSENKFKQANEIANIMFEKGLLKKSGIDDKIKELYNMNNDSLELIKKTISEIPDKTAEEGFSDLTFLCPDNNIKEKETMLNAVNNFFNN